MITSMPARQSPAPIQSLATGRTPSASHSHSSAMLMYTPP